MIERNNLPSPETIALRRLRGLLLGLLFFEMLGVAAELALISHWEDWWQRIPLVLLSAGLAALAGFVVLRNRTALRLYQFVMLAVILGGCLGVWLHYDGRAEFRLESDSTLSGWSLFRAVMSGGSTPPVLAPGVMVQIGILGLIATYRHPAGRPAAANANTLVHKLSEIP